MPPRLLPPVVPLVVEANVADASLAPNPAPAAPPRQPPAVPPRCAVDADDQRPCAECGQQLPAVGAGSSWPWLAGTRICVPCLRKVDQ